MVDTLRSEFRKLYTVRSIYVIIGFSVFLVCLMSFYIEGIRGGAAVEVTRNAYAAIAANAANTCGILAAIVAIVMLSHEYRYNTITYTLTASRSRSKVLLAKIVVISVFSIVYTLAMAALAIAMLYLGAVVVKGYTPAPQDFDTLNLLWRIAFYGWAYGMVGLIFTAIIRNQVGSIVAFLIAPIVVQPLLGLLLKGNHIYILFSALNQVVTPEMAAPGETALTNGSAAIVVAIYLAVGWLAAWLLFLKRDAN